MRWLAFVPSAVMVALLGYSVAAAPPAFVYLGASVYQWPDGRVTFLASLSIVTVLLASTLVLSRTAQKVVAACCGVVAGFNFLLFVVFNYGTNLPDGILPQLFSANVAATVLQVAYWERLSPIYGLAAQAGAWFAAAVASVFALRLPRGPALAVADAGFFAFCTLSVYSAGVLVVIPQWSERAITGLQTGTAVSWFTNQDLLSVSAPLAFALLAVRIFLGRTRPVVAAKP